MILVKTKGIVLSSIKYKESSLIARVYTQNYGLQSFIINGVRSSKPKFAAAFFQPLTLLDIVFYYKENQSLKRLSEVKCLPPLTEIYFDFKKTSISLFITEVLIKILKEEIKDEDLFEFLYSSVLMLDNTHLSSDFHLNFLVKLSNYLGFGISSVEEISKIGKEQDLLERLLEEELTTCIINSNHTRKTILKLILRFYSAHFEGFEELKSLKVLNEIFN